MESTKPSQEQCSGSKSSIEKVSVSTTCKACRKDFTISTIFKHVSHTILCRAKYTNEEIDAFKDWRRKRIQDGQKKSYNPTKRKTLKRIFFAKLKRISKLHKCV